MINQKNRSWLIFVISIVVLSLISLACGASTSKQLASAVPSSEVSSQESAVSPAPVQPQATKPQPSATTNATPTIKPTATTKPEPIVLVTQGIGQNGQELGYGFIIQNPNEHLAYENSQFQIAAYNAEGTVIETDSGYIELILPGQQLGIGGTIYLNEGVTATRIEVQLSAGDAVESDLSDTFTIEKAVYSPSEYYSSVNGVITNPYNKDITSIRVSALIYNDAKEIIGGGYTYLNFLLANSTTGIKIPVTSYGDVASVEIFPALSSLSMLDVNAQLPEGASNIVLSKQGFGQVDSSVGFGMIIENPNQGYAVENSLYHITAYSEDGSIIDVTDGYIDLLLPNQILGIASSFYLDEGVVVSRIETQIKTGDFTELSAIPAFTSENVNFIADEYFPEVTGEIASPYGKDVSNVQVTAIAYNEAGDIIGSGYTYLDFIPANAKAAASVSMTVVGTPAKVELYATATALSDIK